MKTAGLTTLGYSLSASLGILFFGWSASLRSPKSRTLTAGDESRECFGCPACCLAQVAETTTIRYTPQLLIRVGTAYIHALKAKEAEGVEIVRTWEPGTPPMPAKI